MPGRGAAQERSAAEMRILHWNIHSWRDEAGHSNLEAVARVIEETRPHVVSLVEVDEEWQQPSQLDALAERCGYRSIFIPAFEFGDDTPAGARVVTRPTLLAFGERVARVRDPQGHLWWLHERVEGVAPDELVGRFADPAAQEAMAYVQHTLREELARPANWS